MATISDVAICNMAISHCGSSASIESLSEASTEARVCKTWYDWSRIQVLEVANWNFARKRKQLALLATDPTADWSFRYEYPSDCVKARMIENPAGINADAVPFEVTASDDGANNTILTNVEDAKLIYTFSITNTSQFSSLMIDALSWQLASRIAFALTGNAGVVDRVTRSALHFIALASGIDANEGVANAPRDAEHIRVRN